MGQKDSADPAVVEAINSGRSVNRDAHIKLKMCLAVISNLAPEIGG